jgi:hypothetical protein
MGSVRYYRLQTLRFQAAVYGINIQQKDMTSAAGERMEISRFIDFNSTNPIYNSAFPSSS